MFAQLCAAAIDNILTPPARSVAQAGLDVFHMSAPWPHLGARRVHRGPELGPRRARPRLPFAKSVVDRKTRHHPVGAVRCARLLFLIALGTGTIWAVRRQVWQTASAAGAIQVSDQAFLAPWLRARVLEPDATGR